MISPLYGNVGGLIVTKRLSLATIADMMKSHLTKKCRRTSIPDCYCWKITSSKTRKIGEWCKDKKLKMTSDFSKVFILTKSRHIDSTPAYLLL